MDKMNQKMKKLVNLRGVLDGLRTSASTPPKGSEYDVEEKLRSEHFQVAKTVRHGFPYQPTAMAFDPVQNLLAIGTKSGSLRIFGRPGVDCCIQHERDVAVIQILFLVNEGALVSVCKDDQHDHLHLWTLRQKRPEIVHSLKFQRERITQCDLPFQSKWLYIGTERGNVHIVNIESFVLSGYVINWNKAIELSRKTHPGPVVHLSDNPMDSTKLLIGFESGAIVLWDLKTKTAECRFNCSEALRSIAWHHEGKQFMCSHADGSLSTWNIKEPKKPASVFLPHAKTGKDGKPEPCKPISKLEWKTVRNADPYVIFSGGMPYDKASRTPSLTVIQAKSTTVLEMEHNVVDFLTLCSTPYNNDFQDPYGIVVLLQNDLVVVDLTSPGYPCFENPYPMDIHESPVTACQYFADCPTDLIPAFYSVGAKQKRTEGFSEKDWPVKGGEWGATTQSYPEIMITGHADGSLKFWDASMSTLQVLYKLKTGKVFEKSKCKSPDSDDDPFAIQHIKLCLESRLLVVAGITHLMLFRFSKQESSTDPTILEINIVYEIYDDIDSPEECIYPPNPPPKPALGSTQSGSIGSYSSNASDGKESQASVKVKTGSRKWSAGYQPDLVGVLTWIDGEPPPPITAISVNSHYGLLAFGNECGLAIVDTVQKTCLLNMGTPDLYGSMDPYSRVPRSPKSKNQPRPVGLDGLSQPFEPQECKSPTSDQINGVCLSPTNTKQKRPHPEMKRTKSQDKADGSFSRSRSSSISSLDNVSKEAITAVVFADSYCRKTDAFTSPSLYVGTSLGSCLAIVLQLPMDGEQRKTQPVIVSPSGTIFRLQGAILGMSFLDSNGLIIPSMSDQWRDEKEKKYTRQQSVSSMKAGMSPTSSTEQNSDRQFGIICSEKHARVMSLPSQTCAYKVKITDTSVVCAAQVVTVKDMVYLATYVANGHIQTFSLPSLKPLLDVDFLPSTDIRVAKTFSFSHSGHAMYFCSPTEVQKITLSADISLNLNDMLGELFLAVDTPEAPKQGFFKNLFGQAATCVDREELFGESSGKASRGVATKTVGSAGMATAQEKAQLAGSEIGRAKLAAMERGEKLGQLEDRTEHMRNEAEQFAYNAHLLMNKYKDKKWYQF